MKGYVYILTNNKNRALYTGVTSNLKDRLKSHYNHKYPGSFTARYNFSKLVYFEICETIGEAIKREKQIKAGSRQKKIDMIDSMNPEWDDLSVLLDG